MAAFTQRRGQLLGMTIGSGLNYKYAEMNQIDAILTLSASRFRQMGVSSLAGSLPFSSANRMVYDYATSEILTRDPHIPVIFGLCAVDPTIVLEEYIQLLQDSGFAGICNMPTVSIMDGRYRAELERSGFSFRREVEAVATAHRKEFFTVAMVRDKEQTADMLQAGCDVICVHFGAAKGGMLGTQREMSLHDAVSMADEIFSVCDRARPEVIKMLYGGPAKTPSTIRYLMECSHADGFIGGYTFERLLLEKNVEGNLIKETFFPSGPAGSAAFCSEKIDYVEYLKEYVETHYHQRVTLNDIARDLYISRPYLSALVKKELGESFSDYLIGYRMYRASSLLLNTALSVSEIGALVGYPDHAHFSKLFYKRIGSSPARYRKQYKNT